MSETVHAGCVAIGGRGVLIAGASGRGKSDLALRLIDRGARLVSDDYSLLQSRNGRLIASAPASIAGRIEVRGVGIVDMDALEQAPVCLLVDLDAAPERLPVTRMATLLECSVPALGLDALEASAPIKVETALRLFGLQHE
ncbi:MAG TPA: HPr kinase/phosphatase C-terminal domain-containing protein [Allosphingosinicella sp.]|jgi:serine kinase of HPr protein (carbohydrate metabolism regulator)